MNNSYGRVQILDVYVLRGEEKSARDKIAGTVGKEMARRDYTPEKGAKAAEAAAAEVTAETLKNRDPRFKGRGMKRWVKIPLYTRTRTRTR